MSHELEGRAADVRLFGPFRLDVRDERLCKGGQELTLRRKPFAILRYLTANPARLVTQEEVVEAVWGKIAMSESLLRTHVSELRAALRLAKLDRGAKKRAALEELRRVYGAFTKGLGTGDLVDAKSLLDGSQ